MARLPATYRIPHKVHARDIELELAAIERMSLQEAQQSWQQLGQVPQLPLRLLRHLLAQLLQEQAHGALPTCALTKLEVAAVSPEQARCRATPPPPRRVMLTEGTRLVREWNGRTISVDVVGEGYVWNEQHYGSLSEIARTVTGTRWSGPRFFGVEGRG